MSLMKVAVLLQKIAVRYRLLCTGEQCHLLCIGYPANYLTQAETETF